MTQLKLAATFERAADFVLFEGDCLELLPQIPDGFVKLIVTSPRITSARNTNAA